MGKTNSTKTRLPRIEPQKITKKIVKPQKKITQRPQEDSDLDEFDIIMSEIDTNSLTHEEFLKIIRSKCKNMAKMMKGTKNNELKVKEYYMEKCCEICKKFDDDEHMLICDYCEDSYHSYCLNPPLLKIPDESETWGCPLCEANIQEINKKSKKKPRQSVLEEHFEQTKSRIEKPCFKCNKIIKNEKVEKHKNKKNSVVQEADECEICVKCQNQFHKSCFGNKKNAIVCCMCVSKIEKQIPSNQTSLFSYFKTKSKQQVISSNTKEKVSTRLSNSITNINTDIHLNPESIDNTKNSQMRLSTPKKRNVGRLNIKKKKNKIDQFRLPQLSKDPKINMQAKQSLIYALMAKNLEFDDDLRFSNPDCPASCNDTKQEPTLQKISSHNLNIFIEFKKMTRQGNYPPVLVEEDKQQGFIVRALEDIPVMTLICEYVGEVDFLRNRVFDKNDSIMDLLKTARSKTALVICPEKYGNLARFLSGINNAIKSSQHKQNVQSIRMDIQGHARVFLFAKKNIKKNEILYYDYNAGGFGDYPTEDFV